MIRNRKSNFLTDNLGWILLALLLAVALILAMPGIAEGFDKSINFVRNWR